jgi:isoquinoline 1-oxidoreductase beta subunit
MQQISRRNFIKNTSGAGIAFWIGISTAKGSNPMKALDFADTNKVTPYLMIDAQGGITIINPKPEMGQGTWQSIPALIAEELEISLDQVNIVHSSGQKDIPGRHGAGGSASIRTGYNDLRKVGAAAKEMFIKAASNKWGVDVSDCYAENGKVIQKSTKKSFTYGELAADAAKLEVPKEPKLKDRKDFKILGKAAKRPDIPLKVNGKAEFGIDVQLPNMVYATVERCPVIGGTLKSFDASAALKVAGVEKVVEVEKIIGNGKCRSKGVAVIANTYWAALKGRKMLKIEWNTEGYETFNSAEYEDKLRNLAKEEGIIDKTKGSVDTLNLKPENTIEALYETPMVAHHALEPMNCVAYAQGDKLEIWTSTQVTGSVVGSGPIDLPKLVGFAPENVKVNTKFIGGGLGRRLNLDFIVEAANIAKQITKPVKVIWSREDTTHFSPHRPMTFSQLKGGFSDEGKLVSFQHKVISPSYAEVNYANFDKTKVDNVMVEGIGEQAYEIPNIKTAYVRAEYHVPVAPWRSVTSSTLAFAHECFMDELAHKANKDPLNFRLELLTKPSDAKRVLQKLKEVSNWDTPMPKGKGRGVAHYEFFAGQCAQVVEVTYNADKSIKIDKVIAVIDLGEMVNPNTIQAQVEGAVIMALGAATQQGITFKDGKIEQSNFHDTPILRINELPPPVEVHILTEGGKIKGVGEPGLPPFAPALANAIFMATGKRIRKMPFSLENV